MAKFMKKRLITKISKVKFKPFDNYGKVFKGMDWHKITYDKKSGQGSYILKLKPNTQTPYHKHANYEEFYILDGELIDEDNTKLNKGDFISFKPGSRHSSYTKKGCTLLVFMRKKNKLL